MHRFSLLRKKREPTDKLPTPQKARTMSTDSKKSNKITEIVRLRQILKKWRRVASSSKTTTTTTTSSKSIKFLKRTLSLSEREGGSINFVPKGYLAVCVGEELKRFIIPTEYLGHQAFHMLLREAEEEFGFQQTGVLRIPCEVSAFESILKMMEGKKDKVSTQVSHSTDRCSEDKLSCSHHPHSPLCR